MKTNTILRNIIIFSIIILNIGCDQVTKNIAREHLEYNRRVEVVSSYLIYKKVENTGAFLSLGNKLNPTLRKIILLGLPMIVMLGMMFMLIWRHQQLTSMTMLGLSFIVGGGIGNLIDRVLYDSVTDFLHIDLGFAHTGIFNTADMSVMVGLGLLIWSSIFKK